MLNSKYHLWHYKKFVNKNYKNQINKLYDFEFLEDLILIQNDSYETKLSTTQLEKIIELDTIIFLQLKDDL